MTAELRFGQAHFLEPNGDRRGATESLFGNADMPDPTLALANNPMGLVPKMLKSYIQDGGIAQNAAITLYNEAYAEFQEALAQACDCSY